MMTAHARAVGLTVTLALVPAGSLAASDAPAGTPRVSSPLVADLMQLAGPLTQLDLDLQAYGDLKQMDEVVITGFHLGALTRKDLVLERFEILTEDAQLVRGTAAGDVELPRPDVVLLRGHVDGQPGSTVFLGLSPHGTNGIIQSDEGRHVIASGPGRPTVIYDLDGLPPGALKISPFICGTDELPLPEQPVRVAAAGVGCIAQATIAIETDWEFTEHFGNTAASSAYALELIAAVSEIFARDTGTALGVTFLRVWPDANDPWSETGAGARLNEFRTFWLVNMDKVQRNTAHFLTTYPLEGAGGIAYLPGLCQDSFAYGLSGHLNGSFPYPLVHNDAGNWDVVVVTHELGHNFGAPHTHDMEPPIDECAFGECANAVEGTIMSYCHTCSGVEGAPGISNINLRFHERIIDEEIVPYLTSGLPCVLGVSTPDIVQHPSNVVACETDTVDLLVLASGGDPLSYQWRKDGTPIPGATNSVYTIVSATIADSGAYDVVVSNKCGTLTSNPAVVTVSNCPPPPPPCPWDLTGDGSVGITDVFMLFGNWGQSGVPGDFNNDNVVGIEDFFVMLGRWGACP